MFGNLLRDNVPARIEAKGKACSYAILQNDELFRALLRDRLVETVNAFLVNNSAENFCEVQLVLDTIKQEAAELIDTTYKKQIEELGKYDRRYIWVQAGDEKTFNQVEAPETNEEAVN